jgi:hypothetical protein
MDTSLPISGTLAAIADIIFAGFWALAAPRERPPQPAHAFITHRALKT